jgi:KDO2-lipid IV(A) lauroyltransferase
MEALLVLLARGLLAGLQALPLNWVARLGRACGGLAWALDARHRRVALENLRSCFAAEKPDAELARLARENFRRLGENYACAVRTAAMSGADIRNVLTVAGTERIRAGSEATGGSVVVAIGHFGNFELYARASLFLPEFQMATTYRALRQPGLTRLLQDLRARSGCLYFERRSESGALREAMNRQRLMLGLLADQDAGERGLAVPFFGRECSTSAAPAVFALRYECPLHVAICYRAAPARWHIEVSEAIPTHAGGHPRPVADIMREVNQAYETAVRRDPANWFWVHRRWKRRGREPGAARESAVTPPAAEVL